MNLNVFRKVAFENLLGKNKILLQNRVSFPLLFSFAIRLAVSLWPEKKMGFYSLSETWYSPRIQNSPAKWNEVIWRIQIHFHGRIFLLWWKFDCSGGNRKWFFNILRMEINWVEIVYLSWNMTALVWIYNFGGNFILMKIFRIIYKRRWSTWFYEIFHIQGKRCYKNMKKNNVRVLSTSRLNSSMPDSLPAIS